MNEPLALKLRPKKLDDILGQDHLIGKNKILTNLVNNERLFSFILYGTPGIGKTSIAIALVNSLKQPYRMFNAVLNNKKDLDIIIEEAKLNNGMILIIDEIHRLNRDKQDILLPCLESGLLTLIGLTTTNPYHSINSAIRSRCHILKLNSLDNKDIIKGLNIAINSGYLKDISIDKKSIDYIAKYSKNDLRVAYNLLELAYFYDENHLINVDKLKELNLNPNISNYDEKDDEYNLLSGLQKSIRGSDVDASLHYLARLLLKGDIENITRRLSVIAYEDIGLANPSIGNRLESAINLAYKVGMPENRIILSEIVIEMSLSPKSNTAYLAINKAIEDVKTKDIGNIPEIVKNPNKGYKYPHDYKNTIIKQQYLPEGIKNAKYFVPKDNSKNERELKQINENINKIKNQTK